MRRVVVTGLGIVSSIGNNAQEVDRLAARGEVRHRRGRRSMSAWASARQVDGSLKIDLEAVVDRRARRFMGDGAAYSWLAMEQAIADSGLEEKDISNERTGLIVGSGGPSTKAIVAAADIARSDRQGPEAHRPLRRAQGDVVDLLGEAVDLVQDQGRQLFDHARPARPRAIASATPPS